MRWAVRWAGMINESHLEDFSYYRFWKLDMLCTAEIVP